MTYSLQNAINAAHRFESTLAVLHSIDTKFLPAGSELYIDDNGDTSYTDSRNHEVHLGVKGVISMWPKFIRSDSDLYSAMEYIRTHELCHILYTGGKSYEWAVKSSIRTICEYIAKQEKDVVRFRKEMDVRNYIHELNTRFGCNVDAFLNNVVCFIANSLEDGRIERIYASKNAGFSKARTYYRGVCCWNCNECEKVDLANPLEKLNTVLCQTLSLATCQVYQKGFTSLYGTTDLYKLMNELSPLIADAYLARNTHAMAEACNKICAKLSPLAYECLKMDHETINDDVKKLLEELLKQLFTKLAESDDMGSTDSTASDDDTGEMNSVFGQSDLTVVLPDDVYDKLKNKAKDSEDESKENGGINIVREHPLEDEKESDDRDKSNSDSSSSSPSDSDNNADASDSSNASASSSSGEGKESRSSNSSNSEAQSTEQNKATANQKLNGSDTTKDSASESTKTGKEVEKTKNSGGRSDNAPSAEEIKKIMKTAAKAVKAEAKDAVDSINQAATIKNTAKKAFKEQSDTSKTLSDAEAKKICSNYREYFRAYSLTKQLPYDIAQRGAVLHQKISRYFKSLMTPTVRNRKNGILDQSALTRLAKNKTNVFMKKGKSKDLNACVYILIDNSGSMSGAKKEAACKAAAIIEEGFKGLMPIKIVAFDSSETINHEIIKNWNEVTQLNCCWNYCNKSRNGYGNEDNFDIKIASAELMKRPEAKKMLIVLSDGAPSDTKATRSAIREARKKGIKVSGIYFEQGTIGCDADDFIYMYEKDYVCCTTREIDSELEKVLQKFAHSK